MTRTATAPSPAATGERAFLTAKEVGTLLNVGVNRVYVMAAQGLIPAKQLGRRWLFPRAGYEALIQSSIDVAAVESTVRDDTMGRLLREIEQTVARTVATTLEQRLREHAVTFQQAAAQGAAHGTTLALTAADDAAVAARRAALTALDLTAPPTPVPTAAAA